MIFPLKNIGSFQMVALWLVPIIIPFISLNPYSNPMKSPFFIPEKHYRCFMVESRESPTKSHEKNLHLLRGPKIFLMIPCIFVAFQNWFSKNRGFPKIIGLPPVKKSRFFSDPWNHPSSDKWWVPPWLQVVGPPVDRVQLVNITSMSHNYGLWYANNYTIPGI